MIRNTLLATTILGVIGGSVFSTAYADGINTSTYCKPGFYAGLQGGWSDTFYNPNEVFSQAALNGSGVSSTTTTSAVSGAEELSQGVGDYFNDRMQTNVITTFVNNGLHDQTSDTQGIGGRIYAGYQFMPYFAAELGFDQFAKSTFNATGIATFTTTDTTTTPSDRDRTTVNTINTWGSTTTLYSGDITQHAIDLVAKGTLPLPYGFGVYIKGGAAYITAERDVNSHVVGSTSNSTSTSQVTQWGWAPQPVVVTGHDSGFSNVDSFSTVYTQTYQAFRPVAGAGVDYTIPNTNFDVEASYTRIFGSGAIDNSDLGALGVNYKFD